ncbi:hypothetical protein BS78_07G054300 [Paspalum vaginatum]|nr:hypothetical protein BS78_07G054300 [Paspalum vaginatum]
MNISCLERVILIGLHMYFMVSSLNWQHSRCEKPKQRPELMTLYSDQSCDASRDGAESETEEQKMGARRTKVESEKIKTWKLADIYDSGYLQSLCMPEPDKLATTRSKVVGLLYTDDGIALWALGSNAIFKCWKWQHSDRNPNRKLWITAKGISMKNDTRNSNPEKAIASIAMSNNGTVMSASGSSVSLFCLKTPRVLSTFNGPPPTCITIHPDDCQIVAFGMNDSTILVCSYFGRQLCARVKLCGHQNMITILLEQRWYWYLQVLTDRYVYGGALVVR